MKKWLIKILKKILKKLQPTIFEEVSITHSYKPLITIEANLSLNKRDIERLPEGYVKEVLAKRLSEQIIDHMDILVATEYTSAFCDEQFHYRAQIQIADNRN
jgi:hypothetical protein